MIRLRTTGECVIEIGGNTLTPESEVLFAACLYLSCNAGRMVARRDLAELFWPSTDRRHASHCLRQAIYRLRRLGAKIESNGSTVGIPGEEVVRAETSVLDIARAAVDSETDGRVTYLPDYAPRFSPPFEEWVEQRRQHVHAELRRSLLARLAEARARNACSESERIALACLALDPLSEDATHALAEAAVASGRPNDAIALLDRFLTEIAGPDSPAQLQTRLLRKRIASTLVRRSVSSPDVEAAFVGRQSLLQQVTSKFGLEPGASGGAFLLVGQAGIGKTRLAAELSVCAAVHGFQVVRLQSHAGDQARPLAALIDLVPILLRLPGSLGTSPDALACLRPIVRRDSSAPATADGFRTTDGSGSGDAAFARIQESFLDLFEAVHAETKVLMCVEDAHWLDRMSQRLVQRLAALARDRGWVVIATVRTGIEYLSSPLALLDDESFTTLRLLPLEREESRALLRSLPRLAVGQDSIFEEWCLRTADGNPLFLCELARQFLTTGDHTSLPPSIQQLLDRRLRALSSNALMLIQCVAVLGKNASLGIVEATLQLASHAVLSGLDELSRAELLTNTEGVIACRHDLVADSALGLLSREALLYLHRLVGGVLEREFADTRSFAVLWDAALHWSKAGDANRAVDLAAQCGEHLLDIHLPAEAARVFEDALPYCPSPESAAQLLSRLSEAQFRAGQWARMAATLEKRRGLREALADHRGSGDDEARILEALWRAGASCDVIENRVLTASDALTYSAAERAAVIVLGLKYADNVLDIAMIDRMRERLGRLATCDTIPLETLLQAEVIYHSSYGDLGIAASSARELVHGARTSGDELALGRTLRWATETLRRAGCLTEAWECARESVALAERKSLPAEALSSTLALLGLAQHTDAWSEVEANLSKARKYAEMVAPHDPWAKPAVYAITARAALNSRDITILAQLHAHPIDPPAAHRLTRARAKLLAVKCDVANSLVPGSVSRAELVDLKALYSVLCARGDQDYLVSALARLLLEISDDLEADRVLGHYIKTARRERYPLPADLRDLVMTRLEASTPVTERARMS